MKHSRRIGFLALALLCLAPVAAEATLTAAGGASVEFVAMRNVGGSINGKTSDLSIVDDGSNLTFTVKLANIATGMDKLNEHTKKQLEADKFPTVVLTVPRASIKFPSGSNSSGDAQGSLTLHGVTKPVSVHYTATPSGKGFDVVGTTSINYPDFGIATPSMLGVTVKPGVNITVKFSANDA